MRTILAISPHPDDVELGLGGYLSRLRREEPETKVEIAVMASGSASTTKAKGLTNPSTRVKEAEAAAKLLGAKLHWLRAAQDGAFNMPPHSQIVTIVERFIFDRDTCPDELFIPLPSFHRDHTITYEAAISALRPRAARWLPKKVLAYEYPGHHWGPQPPGSGKVYKTLTGADLSTKITSLACYASQWVSVHDAPGLGGDAVCSLARLRGSEVGADAAELFFLIREVQ